MKLRTGKQIGYEFSRGADYILFSVNDLRALFMEVIDTYGCKLYMTATEYFPYPNTRFYRINERTLAAEVSEMYFRKGIEKEEFPFKLDLKFERDYKDDPKS
jgi:hypothetical protein